MIKASIIVPTRNRSKYLEIALQSLLLQDYQSFQYEIIIVDNGSSDNTRKISESYRSNNLAHNIKYIFEPEPGLLSGRHRGALNAKGEILIFIDDDIEAVKGWLSAIMDTFKDETVHLVGGPSLPKYEVTPPEWINKYFQDSHIKKMCSHLSLLYMGDQTIEIDPNMIWGLNFSIRKKTLFDLGGFHPDGVPGEYIHFRGDGETGLSLKIIRNKLRSLHNPKALVYHLIQKERLTVKYFEQRFYLQGISDSYTRIRKNKGLKNVYIPTNKFEKFSSNTSAYDQYKQIIYQRIENAYVDGFRYHQNIVKNNENMLKWVLKDHYFDYRYPKFSENKDADIKKSINLSTAVIYITELCNSRCITCSAWKNKSEKQLDTKTWFRILQQIREIGISTVAFVGGEPLIRKDILQIVNNAKSLNFKNILICSNGRLLNNQMLNRIVECGATGFHISLDGLRNTYKYIRGVDWFDSLLSSIRMIAEKKVSLLILTTLVRQNITELENIVLLAKEIGAQWFPNILENNKYLFKNIDMTPIQIINQHDIKKTISILENLVEKFPKTCAIQKEDILYINDYLTDQKCERKIPCTLGYNTIYIDPKANLYTSCMSIAPVGNLLYTPLSILIKSTTMYSRIDSMIHRKCSGCTCGYTQRAKIYYDIRINKGHK